MEFLSEIIHRSVFLIENGAHNRDSIIIVLEGSFTCSMEAGRFTAEPGSVCVFRGGERFRRKVIKPLRCVYLQFEPFPFELPSGLLTVGDPVRAENTVYHLERAVLAGDRNLQEHLIWDLVFLHGMKERPVTDEIVASCICRFHRDYGQRLSLEELAQAHSITRQGLIRKFRRHTGQTPMAYLTAVRLEQSKRLLTGTSLSVGEIGERCGFENVYYFSNCFKAATGRSPTAYRALMTL